jgi:hypothetical protein
MTDQFDKYCHFKRMKLRADEDWVSIYDGREGSGKSNAAILDAYATSGDLFNITEHICYDPEELMRLVDDVPRYGSIILDEAGEAFFSRSFRDSINVAIAKTLQQMRYRNLNVLLNVPHKDYIDLIGRNRARAWIHLSATKRGYGEFLMPFRNKYHSRDEPYWKTLFFYQFAPLPKPLYNEYRVIKEKKSRERMARYIDETERKKDKLAGRPKDKDPDIEELLQRARSFPDQDSIVNNFGKYSANLLKFHLKIKPDVAQVLAKRLNTTKELNDELEAGL